MIMGRRAIGILTSVIVVCAAVVVLQTHAADEPDRKVAPTPKVRAAKSPAPGAPQVPEESATIRDDPTIAPDPKQSADNNVSFPNDI
jgi:hypothetical protein